MRVAIQLCPRYEACVLFAHQVSSLAMSSGTDDRRLLLRLAVCVSIYVTLTSGAPVRDAEAIGQVEATQYLRQFDYIARSRNGKSGGLVAKDKMATALKTFQRMVHIPVTGKLDSDTKRLMVAPRCGMGDSSPDTSNRTKRFISWGRNPPRVRRHKLTYKVIHYTKQLTREQVNHAIERAFQLWSSVSPLTFTRSDARKVDLEISFEVLDHGDGDPFDGRGRILGHAFYPTKSDLHLDDDEPWLDYRTMGPYGTDTGLSTAFVLMHEIGHALGLRHSKIAGAVMHPLYNASLWRISEIPLDDIHAIQDIYGARPGRHPQLSPKQPSATPTEPSPSADFCRGHHFDAISVFSGRTHYIFAGELYGALGTSGLKDSYPKLIRSRWPQLRVPIRGVFHNEYKWFISEQRTWIRHELQTLFFGEFTVWRYVKDTLQSGFPIWTHQLFDGLRAPVDSVFTFEADNGIYFLTDGARRIYRYVDYRLDSDYPVSVRSLRGFPNGMRAAYRNYHTHKTFVFGDDMYYEYDINTDKIGAGYPKDIRQQLLRCAPPGTSREQMSWRGGTASDADLFKLPFVHDNETKLSPAKGNRASESSSGMSSWTSFCPATSLAACLLFTAVASRAPRA